MGILEDVLKALDRIPNWKRIQAMPNEIQALEGRIKILEARMAPASGEACPSCRAMAFKLLKSEPAPPPWGEMGVRQDHFQCSACHYSDTRQRSPS